MSNVIKFDKDIVEPMDVHDGMGEFLKGNPEVESVAVIYQEKGGRIKMAYSAQPTSDLLIKGAILQDYAVHDMKGE